MAEETENEDGFTFQEKAENDVQEEKDPEDRMWKRSTAPQSQYSMRQVGTGLILLLIGVLITFGIPLALT